MESRENIEMLFSALVIMLHSAAMQQLGKLKHPVTGKIERHLASAKDTIDLLDMLSIKTRGNLTDEESRLVSQVIAELKLNYVDEAAKPDTPPEPATAGEGEKHE